MVVQRITLFQVREQADLELMAEQYRKVASDARKDGKPYLLSCEANPTVPDERSKGYNFAVRSSFDSLDDMKYYDSECAAHKALKAFAMPRINGPPTVIYFEV